MIVPHPKAVMVRWSESMRLKRRFEVGMSGPDLHGDKGYVPLKRFKTEAEAERFLYRIAAIFAADRDGEGSVE